MVGLNKSANFIGDIFSNNIVTFPLLLKLNFPVNGQACLKIN